MLLAGSVAKGVADAYSDLDVIVVWSDAPDAAFLDGAPLPGGERFTNVAHDDGGRIEQYWVGSLKVDAASLRRSSLVELLDDVVVRFDPDPMKQKVCQGFAEGVALQGTCSRSARSPRPARPTGCNGCWPRRRLRRSPTST